MCEYSFATRTSKILTKGPRDGMQPFWANDGRHLYFTERSASGHTRIMILDTEFDEARPLPCTIPISEAVPKSVFDIPVKVAFLAQPAGFHLGRKLC